MISPFFINFSKSEHINKLKNKFWFLCDGSSHSVNGIGRTTPDLRGRFSWGGGKGKNNTIHNFTGMWGDSYNKFRGLENQKCCGEAETKLTTSQMPKHSHNFSEIGVNQAQDHMILNHRVVAGQL